MLFNQNDLLPDERLLLRALDQLPNSKQALNEFSDLLFIRPDAHLRPLVWEQAFKQVIDFSFYKKRNGKEPPKWLAVPILSWDLLYHARTRPALAAELVQDNVITRVFNLAGQAACEAACLNIMEAALEEASGTWRLQIGQNGQMAEAFASIEACRIHYSNAGYDNLFRLASRETMWRKALAKRDALPKIIGVSNHKPLVAQALLQRAAGLHDLRDAIAATGSIRAIWVQAQTFAPAARNAIGWSISLCPPWKKAVWPDQFALPVL